MARTKITARIRTMGSLPPSAPPRVRVTPVVGKQVAMYTARGNGVPVSGTVIYVTPSKRRIHVQLEGQLTLFSLRMNGRWLPVGAALHAEDGWLELEPEPLS